jgi:hypothetical protein
MWNLHADCDGFGPGSQLVMVLVEIQELPDEVTMAVVWVNVGRSDVLIELLNGDVVGAVEDVLVAAVVEEATDEFAADGETHAAAEDEV